MVRWMKKGTPLSQLGMDFLLEWHIAHDGTVSWLNQLQLGKLCGVQQYTVVGLLIYQVKNMELEVFRQYRDTRIQFLVSICLHICYYLLYRAICIGLLLHQITLDNSICDRLFNTLFVLGEWTIHIIRKKTSNNNEMVGQVQRLSPRGIKTSG